MRLLTRVRGFTLIEMLVALAVVAVLGVMAWGGLIGILKNQAAGQVHAQRLAQLQLAYRLIERDIQQAVDRPVRDAFGDSLEALVGNGDTGLALELTRGGWRNPGGGLRSTLQRVAWGIREQRLVRLYWRVLDRAQDSEPVEQAVLEGVRELEMRFLGDDDEWYETWPPEQEEGEEIIPPRAVEVGVRLEDWGELRWLFLLAV